MSGSRNEGNKWEHTVHVSKGMLYIQSLLVLIRGMILILICYLLFFIYMYKNNTQAMEIAYNLFHQEHSLYIHSASSLWGSFLCNFLSEFRHSLLFYLFESFKYIFFGNLFHFGAEYMSVIINNKTSKPSATKVKVFQQQKTFLWKRDLDVSRTHCHGKPRECPLVHVVSL